MSLILDALRRSEGDVSSTLDCVPMAEPVRDPFKRWIFIAVLLMGVVLGGVAVMIGSGAQEVSAPIISSIESVTPDANGGMPTASRAEATVTGSSAPEDDTVTTIGASGEDHAMGEIGDNAPQVKASNDGRIAELHRQMWSDAEQMPSELPVSPSLSKSAPRPHKTLPETGDAESQSLAPPFDLAKAMLQAARAAGEPTLVPHLVTLLENLSQQQKNRVPTIVYSDHVFAPSGISSVELNGQRLLAGQQAGGIEVVEILTDSVILRAGGSEFRLRALNTWVNL